MLGKGRTPAAVLPGWPRATAGFHGSLLIQLLGCSASTAGVWVQMAHLSEEPVGCQISSGMQ